MNPESQTCFSMERIEIYIYYENTIRSTLYIFL